MQTDTSYRDLLKNEWAQRAAKNPRYSLRAFAATLEIAPSTLSEVLAGKKNISLDRAMAICEKLAMKGHEKSYFLSLVQLETSNQETNRLQALKKIEELHGTQSKHNLTLDGFRLISDWYHYPVMELTQVSGFEFTPRNIATKLGISMIEASNAIQRLERLELIEKNPQGKYRQCKETVVAQTLGSSDGIRSFHRQMLGKALTALETQTNKEKFVGSETLAFDSHQLEKANEIFEECFKNLLSLSKKSQRKDHVYHAGIQFFKLTKNK